MNELSLFSGAGGGLLGSKLLGWKAIGYVEFNDYCQRVLKARIEDGILDEAPIFGDIRAFISEGFAASYTGLVDVLTAGFPCQPFSVAGKQAGEDDPRNMWPETLECLRIVRPRFAFFENVPGLLAHPYGRTIFKNLAESGYECRWRILSAAELGAPHKRDRLWIVASNTDKFDGHNGGLHSSQFSQQQKTLVSGGKEDVAHAESQRTRHVSEDEREACRKINTPYDPSCAIGGADKHSDRKNVAESEESRLEKLQRKCGEHEGLSGPKCPGGSWWATEPDMGRVAHGVAHRVDRLKAIGNGQVPLCAAAAWRLLNVSSGK